MNSDTMATHQGLRGSTNKLMHVNEITISLDFNRYLQCLPPSVFGTQLVTSKYSLDVTLTTTLWEMLL